MFVTMEEDIDAKKPEMNDEWQKKRDAKIVISKWKEQLTALLVDPSQQELSFPATLSSKDRQVIHTLAEKMHLSAMSSGQGKNRFIKVSKKDQELKADNLPRRSRKTFLKDFPFPIVSCDSPYFEYCIELLEQTSEQHPTPLYRIQDTLKLLEEAWKELGGDDAVHQYRDDLKGKIIKAIEATEGYKRINDLDDKELKKQYPLPSRSQQREEFPKAHVYSVKNSKFCEDGGYFLSIDLQSANFQAIRQMDPGMVFGTSSWKELCARFTQLRYFQESKVFRLTVFSKLLFAKQRHVWESIIYQTFSMLIDNDILKRENFVGWSSDEVLFSVPSSTLVKDTSSRVKEFIQKNKPDWSPFLKVEVFTVKELPGSVTYYPSSPCFLKETVTNWEDLSKDTTLQFKGINKFQYPTCARLFFGQPVTSTDAHLSTMNPNMSGKKEEK